MKNSLTKLLQFLAINYMVVQLCNDYADCDDDYYTSLGHIMVLIFLH